MIGKVEKALPNSQIYRFSKMLNKPGDLKKLNQILGAMKLPDIALRDAYLRIMLIKKLIDKDMAERILKILHKTKGVRSTLSKILAVNTSVSKGHLNELKIALNGAESGFKVIEIGKKFKDGIKRITDIDVILKKKGLLIAMEAKNYSFRTKIPIDKFRADMNTLIIFKEKSVGKVMTVFSMTELPDRNTLKILKKEAKRRGIELIFGSPQDQIIQINQLATIY
jgi:hypothetical protein